MEISDNHIVEQVKGGDVEAYSELVLRYQKPIYNLMYRFSYSTDEAAELTQDVFCNAFEKLSRFNSGKRFFPWLFTLALNIGRDWSRKNARNNRSLLVYRDSLAQNHDSLLTEKIEVQQQIDQMVAALRQLPVEKREILLLRYRQELSVRELAEIFSLSESGVKMRIHRALDTLHTQLGGEGESHE